MNLRLSEVNESSYERSGAVATVGQVVTVAILLKKNPHKFPKSDEKFNPYSFIIAPKYLKYIYIYIYLLIRFI